MSGIRVPWGSAPNPKLLAVDLDGTLLDIHGSPHPSDLRALRSAMAEGIRVSIITGRLYSGTRPVAQLLGLRTAVGCVDGSHLVDAGEHTTLIHMGVRGTEAKILRSVLARARLVTFVFAQDAIGHDAAANPLVEYVTTWSRDLRPVSDVFEHPLWDGEEGVTAVIGVGHRDEIEYAEAEIARDLPSAAVAAKFPVRRGEHREKWAILVRASGGTKGTALRWIAQHEQVRLEDTVCVGDWINDVAMFELAGRSFAMGQAPHEVKTKATDVLDETAGEGGGVARAIAEAFGIT